MVAFGDDDDDTAFLKAPPKSGQAVKQAPSTARTAAGPAGATQPASGGTGKATQVNLTSQAEEEEDFFAGFAIDDDDDDDLAPKPAATKPKDAGKPPLPGSTRPQGARMVLSDDDDDDVTFTAAAPDTRPLDEPAAAGEPPLLPQELPTATGPTPEPAAPADQLVLTLSPAIGVPDGMITDMGMHLAGQDTLRALPQATETVVTTTGVNKVAEREPAAAAPVAAADNPAEAEPIATMQKEPTAGDTDIMTACTPTASVVTPTVLDADATAASTAQPAEPHLQTSMAPGMTASPTLTEPPESTAPAQTDTVHSGVILGNTPVATTDVNATVTHVAADDTPPTAEATQPVVVPAAPAASAPQLPGQQTAPSATALSSKRILAALSSPGSMPPPPAKVPRTQQASPGSSTGRSTGAAASPLTLTPVSACPVTPATAITAHVAPSAGPTPASVLITSSPTGTPASATTPVLALLNRAKAPAAAAAPKRAAAAPVHTDAATPSPPAAAAKPTGVLGNMRLPGAVVASHSSSSPGNSAGQVTVLQAAGSAGNPSGVPTATPGVTAADKAATAVKTMQLLSKLTSVVGTNKHAVPAAADTHTSLSPAAAATSHTNPGLAVRRSVEQAAGTPALAAVQSRVTGAAAAASPTQRAVQAAPVLVAHTLPDTAAVAVLHAGAAGGADTAVTPTRSAQGTPQNPSLSGTPVSTAAHATPVLATSPRLPAGSVSPAPGTDTVQPQVQGGRAGPAAAALTSSPAGSDSDTSLGGGGVPLADPTETPLPGTAAVAGNATVVAADTPEETVTDMEVTVPAEFPAALLDRHNCLHKLEMMLLQAKQAQLDILQTRVDIAVLRNRQVRLDNPLLRARLAQVRTVKDQIESTHQKPGVGAAGSGTGDAAERRADPAVHVTQGAAEA